jgi:hypothetical protein
MTRESERVTRAHEIRSPISDPSVILAIVLGADEPIKMIQRGDQNERTDSYDNGDQRSHLTRMERTGKP